MSYKTSSKEYQRLPKVVEYQRKYQKSEKYLKNKRKYNSRPEIKEKISCRNKLRSAIRYGKMRKGKCEVCGSIEVESHHEDYSSPYNVRWLCAEHHLELHNKKINK